MALKADNIYCSKANCALRHNLAKNILSDLCLSFQAEG